MFDKWRIFEGVAYFPINTAVFNGGGGGTNIYFTSTQITGMILSTDESEGCYKIGDQSAEGIVNLILAT